MKKINIIFSLLVALYFSGCNSDSAVKQTQELNKNLMQKNGVKTEVVNTQKLKNSNLENKKNTTQIKAKNQQELKKLEIQKETQLAKIDAQKDLKIKELETKSQITQKELETKAKLEISKEKTTQIKAKTQAQIEIEKTRQKAQEIAIKEHSNTIKNISIIIFLIVVIWLIIRYIDRASKRKHEAELRKKELEKEAYIEEQKLKQKNIDKMLDIIKDSNHDPEVKKEVAKLLTFNSNRYIKDKESKD